MAHFNMPPSFSYFTRRRFLQAAAATTTLAGASALLDACGTSSSPTSSSPVTITVMYNKAELSATQVALFQKQNPTIKVKQLEYDATVLNSMLAAGNPPDVIRTQGAPTIPNIAARGLATDLSDYFAKSSVIKEADLLSVNDVYRWNGHTEGQGPRYGMAKDWSQDAMFWYNKKTFDQAKVPYPSTTKPLSYDELLEIGKKLTVRDNGKIKVYGLDVIYGFTTQAHLMQMLAQRGKSLWSEDYTRANLTDSDAVAAIKWYVDWARAHVGPSPLDPDTNGSDTLFAADREAISLWGYWFGGALYSKYNNTLPDNVGFAPAPQFGSTPVNACFAGTGAWIPVKSKHKDEAWKFFEFFLGGPPAQDRVKSGFGLPALKSLLPELPQGTPAQKEAYTVEQAALPHQTVLHFSPYISDDAFEASFKQYIEPVMKGQADLNNAVRQLQTAVNQLAQQGKQQIS
ncbi:sugar ABC transporter substrate-binding protein [Dictyobacter alpinus]|uniref:Sugar ABC transporter substrate-binding protein n=1 Tax=Dictyobacter alpinus TaxID=2014873 RepID=A0A402BF40_9CHLR|nr:sugar ABC transporter substrate-binding protein [Dictyobacter alpinus]GCE30041.1 sugar ABC transporter substrate-binding protein [Dictyobacter alpinus]